MTFKQVALFWLWTFCLGLAVKVVIFVISRATCEATGFCHTFVIFKNGPF